jgi:RNA polymerase sigma-70 factor (ECF subfamily)
MPDEMTAAPEPSVLDLVQRAQSGQRPQMEELIRRCHRRIHALAFHMLGSQEAEDAGQEALFRIATRLKDLRDPERFWPWALRVAGNFYRDMLRKRKVDALSLDELEPIPGPDDPARAAQESELRGQIKQALRRLSPVLRVTVLLRDIEGFSIQEVADALDLPDGTVKSRLFEARRQLRQLLGGQID